MKSKPGLALWILLPCLASALSDDDLKLIQDPGGWEYISLSDPDNGIQTKHTCFDGRPHPQECSGRLVLSADHSFSQTVHVHGAFVQRHGRYEIEGSDLSFFDEFDRRDGPYHLALDANAKTLTLDSQAVRIELQLEKEYKKNMAGRQVLQRL